MKRQFTALLAICAIALCGYAQAVRIFTTDHDLSSSLVNQLHQTRDGMMWIATEDGLNRYNGNKFTIYRHASDDSTSLCNNFVKSVFEDDDNRIYVCTRRGLQQYHPASDSFGPRLTMDDGAPFTASVNYAIRRAPGEYWTIGDSVKILRTGAHDAPSIHNIPWLARECRNIHCGVVDNDGNLWLSKNESGLFRINSDNSVTHYFGAQNDPCISSMTIGRDGLLYAGTTSHGLMRFNSDSNTFQQLTESTGREIKSLFTDNNGDIVQAIDGHGIMIYTPATGNNRKFTFGNSGFDSDRLKTHCAMRDEEGNIWIGLYQSGVAMLPQQPNSFSYIGHKSVGANVIGHNCVSTLYRDHDNVLWVGADNDGIYALNPDNSLRAHFYNDGIAVPMCIFEDSHNNLWVGTYLNGVGIMDRNTGNMKRIDFSDGPNCPANVCFAMAEDREHNVWVGLLNSGLMKYDLTQGKPVKDFPWRSKIDPWIASLYYSAKTNSLYVGTYSGLQIVDNVSLADPTISHLFSDDVIHSMDEAPDGTLWLATTDGVICYNPATGSSRRYSVADGLHNSTVYAVSHDGRHVWLSLNSGLSRFDPSTGVFSNFLVDDGLQGNEFYKNSVCKDAAGHIYFGGTGGITHFNPRDITPPGRVWTPRIAGLYLHGSRAAADTPLHIASKLKLKHDQNSFSIEFGTRELARPEAVRFAYSIDGKPWEILPAGTNIVNFHNLDAGHHILSIKVVDNLTESDTRTIAIDIAHPWYASAWAKALYATAAVLLLLWSARSYRTRMRHRAELINLTHAEQINEARLQSFVNISHEIRTPMSLVISPLQKLLASDTDAARRHEYGLILRNAKRILRLIDELMDLRKIEKRQMRLTLRRTPLVPFINDLCETFAQVTAGKNISLEFDHADNDISACIDTANFDKILMNLLSNAVKYTPEGGRISIGLTQHDNMVKITVTDTGIGIPNNDKTRIFERFYQAHGNTAGGTGVGLHLTQQLVELHGGTISVTDNPDGNGGSCFTVVIPAGTDTATDNEEKASEIFPGARPVVRQGMPLSDTKTLLLPDLEEPSADTATSNAERILIVEDDEEIRNYLTHELSAKYRVSVCTNGREALDIIFRRAPELIMSDIMMPEMDGLSLTRAIKQNINLNHIPIIILTAMTRDEDNINALEAGADDYVTKPFNIEIVKTKIAGQLARYRQLKNRYSGNQEHDDKIDEINVTSSDEKLMSRIMAVLNREMANTELTVEQLASDVGLSRVHLHRKLKTLTNQSPRDFIRNTRLRQAARLLREKKLSVAEVADLTGFCNAGSFTTSFKRLFGMTPTEYIHKENSEKTTC